MSTELLRKYADIITEAEQVSKPVITEGQAKDLAKEITKQIVKRYRTTGFDWTFSSLNDFQEFLIDSFGTDIENAWFDLDVNKQEKVMRYVKGRVNVSLAGTEDDDLVKPR